MMATRRVRWIWTTTSSTPSLPASELSRRQRWFQSRFPWDTCLSSRYPKIILKWLARYYIALISLSKAQKFNICDNQNPSNSQVFGMKMGTMGWLALHSELTKGDNRLTSLRWEELHIWLSEIREQFSVSTPNAKQCSPRLCQIYWNINGKSPFT